MLRNYIIQDNNKKENTIIMNKYLVTKSIDTRINRKNNKKYKDPQDNKT